MKKVTLVNGVVDTVYLCPPPESIETVDAPDDVFSGWSLAGEVWSSPSASIETLRVEKLGAIATTAAALLSAGAPVASGLHVALDDRSLSDLSIMSGIATVAASRAAAWPESYARGWITIENIRLPLATPADGLALAVTVGNHYAAIVQQRRDLKDAALAAEDAAALEAIDIAAGWPG